MTGYVGIGVHPCLSRERTVEFFKVFETRFFGRKKKIDRSRLGVGGDTQDASDHQDN